jgi:hypothetical protein
MVLLCSVAHAKWIIGQKSTTRFRIKAFNDMKQGANSTGPTACALLTPALVAKISTFWGFFFRSTWSQVQTKDS